MKDKRYTTAKNLISTGYVKYFRDIFEIIPKSTVARDLGINNLRFSRLIRHVEQFCINDGIRMARLFEIEYDKMVDMMMAQYKEDQRRKSK